MLAACDIGRVTVLDQDRLQEPFARTEVIRERGHVALPGRVHDLADRHLVHAARREESLGFAREPRLGLGCVARHEPAVLALAAQSARGASALTGMIDGHSTSVGSGSENVPNFGFAVAR